MYYTALRDNAAVVTMRSGMEVLFSYGTPVAVYDPERGYLKSETKWSQTTTKHVNGWLGNRTADVVPQTVIDKLVGDL